MDKYKKKPVTIEAVQFTGLNSTEIKDFAGENCEVEIYDNEVTPPIAHIIIHTLEGDMKVSKGDYVIKGVKGEFYPCKPDIFEQTYESVEPDKSLEEAAKEYTDSSEWIIGENLEHIDDAFKAGAKWQKSQMLKDAVESNVVITSGGILLSDLRIEDFNYEDKVRIIILKAEEE